jgi:hypothetical protein
MVTMRHDQQKRGARAPLLLGCPRHDDENQYRFGLLPRPLNAVPAFRRRKNGGATPPQIKTG